MSKKVLPQELNTEELLSQLEKSPSNSNEEQITDNILEFLSFYNIKSGDNQVKKRLLYKMFIAWNKGNSYGYKYFATKLGLYFKNKPEYVYLDLDAIDLTAKAKEVFFKKENSKKTKSKFYKNQIEKFIKEKGLKSGKYSVNSSVLYYIYEEWALNSKKKPIKINDFSMILSFYFTHYKEKMKSPYFFYIDKDTLTVDGVTLEKAKSWSENYNKVKEHKAKKKEKSN